MYKLSTDLVTGDLVGVIRLSDGACIPAAPGNRDWDSYLVWSSDEGNEPEPAPEPPSVEVAPTIVTSPDGSQWVLIAGAWVPASSTA